MNIPTNQVNYENYITFDRNDIESINDWIQELHANNEYHSIEILGIENTMMLGDVYTRIKYRHRDIQSESASEAHEEVSEETDREDPKSVMLTTTSYMQYGDYHKAITHHAGFKVDLEKGRKILQRVISGEFFYIDPITSINTTREQWEENLRRLVEVGYISEDEMNRLIVTTSRPLFDRDLGNCTPAITETKPRKVAKVHLVNCKPIMRFVPSPHKPHLMKIVNKPRKKE